MNILDIVFPKLCVGCGQEGSYVCDKCQIKLVVPEQICPMCCRPSLDGWTHPKCRRKLGMERLIVGLPYRGMVQQCLKKVKYKSAWDIIKFLYSLWSGGGSSGKQNQDLGFSNAIITSVPMWPKKVRTRGFNQAELLAELIAKNYKVPNLPAQAGLVILERVRETRPMFGLKKEERRENIEGAFKLISQHTNKLTNQRIMLVDDVWTTGSTMRECARMLKLAGVKEVWGVTLAR